MPTWLPPLVTFLLPAALLAAGVRGFMTSQDALVGLLFLAPLGVGLGYLLAGAWLRGIVVTGGFFALLALAIGAIFVLPADFEEAGALMGGAAIVLAVLLSGAAGAAAWDVWRTLAARAAGGA